MLVIITNWVLRPQSRGLSNLEEPIQRMGVGKTVLRLRYGWQCRLAVATQMTTKVADHTASRITGVCGQARCKRCLGNRRNTS